MGSLAHPQAGYDTTELPIIVRGALKLGLAECLIVVAIGLVSRFLDGPVEIALEGVILVAFGVLLVVGAPRHLDPGPYDEGSPAPPGSDSAPRVSSW